MKMTVRAGLAPALLALLALLAPGASMAAGTDSVRPLHEGVVVDSASGAAYVMSPRGGIDAIELATGNVMWNNRDAAKPLLLKDGKLFAQARPGREGQLVVVALDAKAGRSQGRVDIEIPSFVRANVLDGPSRRFRAQAFESADGATVVAWTAEEGRALQGLVEPEGDNTPVKETAAAAKAPSLNGAVKIDVAAGRAVPVSGVEPRPLTARLAGGDPRQMASIDGRHILRSERNPEGGLWSRYRWTITDAAGVKLGTVDAPVSMAAFVVSGSQLFYVAQPSVRREENKLVEQPLRLRALDLRTGTALWESAVVDATYRGPFPP